LTDGEQPRRRLPAPGGEIVGADAAFEGQAVSGEMFRQSFTFRRSPYPSPQDLREYEEIHPGFTDRMLSLTEREADHRMGQEALETEATIRLARRGQLLAFTVVMTFAGGGIAGLLTGHSTGGLAGILVGAATLVGAFVAPNVFERRARAQLERAERQGIPEATGSAADEEREDGERQEGMGT
jgi:uncharacterized membrane protein